jgi:pyridoxal phosphate enzyme (YggS family)
MPLINLSDVKAALATVQTRIAQACASRGRQPGDVTILAVTKGFGVDAIEAALAAGLTNIGENYYQEAREKFVACEWPKGVARHFVGRVQRNKARQIAALFDVVQTVDDLGIARALDDGAAAQGKTLSVLVQVNAAGDERQGVAPDELADFIVSLRVLSNIRARGLMVVGPHNPEATAGAFERARSLFEELRAASPDFDTLSMGMSDDLELAVAAGSTMVRIGTALFGARPPKAKGASSIGFSA